MLRSIAPKRETPQIRRSPTLQSVARAAGVHPSTAARALDPAQRHRLTDAVVEKVQAEALLQGYRRDATAASLRTGRSGLIAVVLPDFANPLFGSILEGVKASVAERGYVMLACDGGREPERQRVIVDELIARRVEGLILATARRRDEVVTACLDARVPTVLVNRGEDELRASSVVTDDMTGARLAVDHLAALGHERIAYVAGPQILSTGANRMAGFEVAMAARGLDARRIAVAAAYSIEAGEAATRDLLVGSADFTAIATSNDLLALGAYKALDRAGLRCPDDVSVVGHNDTPLVDMVAPPLTTVRIGHAEMGRAAAELLIRQIDCPAAAPSSSLSNAALIVRGSTAAPSMKS